MQNFFNSNYLKNFLNSPTKKRLAENFLSLSALQAVNYLLPLITLPYLVRVLGPEKFGLIAFAQAFIAYFIILTNYGFNLSATREISINRDKKEKISEIFNSVMMVKFLLGVLSFFILVLLLIFVPKFRNDWLVYIFTFGMVIGQILFPVWFFQGMERMKYITFLNTIAKLIFTVCIFVFVRQVSDYIYVPLLNSIGFLIAGILSIWIIFKNFKIKFIFPQLTSIKHEFKEGGYIFISRLSISFYTVSNVFVLGLLTNNTVVGIYSAAEKLITAIKGIVGVILQVMFPYVSKIAKESYSKALNVVNYELKLFVVLVLISCFVGYFLSHNIVFLIFGQKFESSGLIMQILILTIPVITVSAILGQQILLNFGLKKLFTISIVYMSFIHLIMLPIMVYFWKAVGAAIAVLVTEALILIFRLIGLFKMKRDIFWRLTKW